MKGYIKKFKDKKTKITTTAVSLMVKYKQLFKKFNKIWEKTERLMRINFDSKPFYGNDDGNKHIKKKIKKKIIRKNVPKEKEPKEKEQYKCLSIIILDSVLKAYEKYHPQTYLEECRYK